jgi:hypothetical protein
LDDYAPAMTKSGAFVAPWIGGVGITPYAAGQFTTFELPAYAESVVSGGGTGGRLRVTTSAVEMKWLNGWSTAATFEGEFSEGTRSYAGKGVVRYAW